MTCTARFVALSASAFALGGIVGCSSANSSSSAVSCSSVAPNLVSKAADDTCYADNDGITDTSYTIQIAVDDAAFSSTGTGDGGFTKNIIATQNESQVTLTLTNKGTKPHGFQVACVSVCSSYATLPKGCSPKACFPSDSTIAPIDPGTSKTITFNTPTPDNLIYPFSSGAPDDSSVPGLNGGQWSLM